MARIVITGGAGFLGSHLATHAKSAVLELIQQLEVEDPLIQMTTADTLGRIGDRVYREQCANRLFEIVLDLENSLGRGRITYDDGMTGIASVAMLASIFSSK